MSNLADVEGERLAFQLPKFLLFVAISIVFSAFGRLVRGVTTSGAVAGAVACLAFLWSSGISAFTALFTVFALTWAATRLGYSRKQQLGTAEARAGRDALQVLANLGVAGICALCFGFSGSTRWIAGMAAALAEAAADTVSSEVGQVLGGKPRLITNGRPVESGTNGAVSLAGTVAGILAASIVALVSCIVGLFGLRDSAVCVTAAVAGMVMDSVLGATAEGPGRLGNNSVNCISTAMAAALALLVSQ